MTSVVRALEGRGRKTGDLLFCLPANLLYRGVWGWVGLEKRDTPVEELVPHIKIDNCPRRLQQSSRFRENRLRLSFHQLGEFTRLCSRPARWPHWNTVQRIVPGGNLFWSELGFPSPCRVSSRWTVWSLK